MFGASNSMVPLDWGTLSSSRESGREDNGEDEGCDVPGCSDLVTITAEATLSNASILNDSFLPWRCEIIFHSGNHFNRRTSRLEIYLNYQTI